MIRSVVVFVIMICASLSTFAQEKEKKAARPDLPGSFLIDFGFNTGISSPDNWSEAFWGSRTVNLYYQYPFRFGRSKFSFVPGLGLGMERFKMDNNFTLSSDPGPDGNYELIPTDAPTFEVKKSMIIANYFDIPVEFRFDTHPEDIARSFNFAVGARAGFLFDGLTKVKYKEEGENKIRKDKQNHGLNEFRYGFYTRIGIAGFNVFMHYNTSPFFEKDKGPDMTKMNTMTIGISLNGF